MSNNECILCSDEINNQTNFFEFPQNNSKCKCKYFIHNNCINEMKEGWGNKCPICFVEFNNNTVEFQQPIEIIVDNNTHLNALNNDQDRINRQKNCLKFLIIILIIILLLICIGIVVFSIYS
jgi:hypothetical protein